MWWFKPKCYTALVLHLYERVAVGRKYPCTSLWICLFWVLLQSLFHVHLGWNFNTKQPLYVHPFCLWPDENPLAWSGAIHLKKGNNFGCKYSYLYGKSGISRVLTVSIRWCQDVLNWLHGLILGHHDTSWGYISLKWYFGHQIVYKILV